MIQRIELSVPASTGNIGPGFDTLGIALRLRNHFTIEKSTRPTAIEIEGAPEWILDPCIDMVRRAGDFFFRKSGISPIQYTFKAINQVPIARGLASSATFRLAVLEGLNQLLERGHLPQTIVQWAAELEGCTDNVAACYYGGFTASGIVDGRLVYFKVEIPEEILFVAVSPTHAVETDHARAIFAPTIPREEAIFNLNRGILLAMAFSQGRFTDITALFDDRLHQPQRQAAFPALRPLFEVIQAANQAGAIGAFLSGSGSTIMAIGLDSSKHAIAEAMSQTLNSHGTDCEVRFLQTDNEGIWYIRRDTQD